MHIQGQIPYNLEQSIADAFQEKSAHVSASDVVHEQQAGVPTYLTPESLVAYCSTRLTSLNEQMQTIFNQQQTSANVETALSNLATQLNDLPQPASSGQTNVTLTDQEQDNVGCLYQAAVAAAGGKSTTLGQSLYKDWQTFLGTHETNGSSFPESTITNLSQSVKTYMSNQNSDSQTSMIDLQSLMSQEQTAVQLSTNMLQTLNQTTSSITANMKA